MHERRVRAPANPRRGHASLPSSLGHDASSLIRQVGEDEASDGEEDEGPSAAASASLIPPSQLAPRADGDGAADDDDDSLDEQTFADMERLMEELDEMAVRAAEPESAG